MNSPTKSVKPQQGNKMFEMKHELLKCMDIAIDKDIWLDQMILNIKMILLWYSVWEQPLPKQSTFHKVDWVRH